MARFSETGVQRCNLYLSVPVNFPKLEGNEDSYPELGRSSNSPLLCCFFLGGGGRGQELFEVVLNRQIWALRIYTTLKL